MMLVPAPERILVIKLRYVGDVLLTTPVLSRLRESFPKAHLAMLVNPGTDDVVRDHPALDEVLILERGNLARQWSFVRDLRWRRFDLVVDLTDADRSALLSWLSGSPMRLGYNSEGRWRGALYTQVVAADRFAMHTVRYHLRAMEALGLAGSPPAPLLTVAPEARREADRLLQKAGVDGARPFVCLHPGARWWFKAWPAERFAALADLIQTDTAAHALFLGGDHDVVRAAGAVGADVLPQLLLVGVRRPRFQVPGLGEILQLRGIFALVRMVSFNSISDFHHILAYNPDALSCRHDLLEHGRLHQRPDTDHRDDNRQGAADPARDRAPFPAACIPSARRRGRW